ncbi:unnamed protein product, partial [marine sediment metagenome]
DDSAGVGYTMYKLEGDTEWQKYTGPIPVIEDGNHTIEYYSVDRVIRERVFTIFRDNKRYLIGHPVAII